MPQKITIIRADVSLYSSLWRMQRVDIMLKYWANTFSHSGHKTMTSEDAHCMLLLATISRLQMWCPRSCQGHNWLQLTLRGCFSTTYLLSISWWRSGDLTRVSGPSGMVSLCQEAPKSSKLVQWPLRTQSELSPGLDTASRGAQWLLKQRICSESQ